MPEDKAYLKSKLKTVAAQLPYLPRTLQLVWQAARPWTVAWLILLLIQGVLPVATVFLTRMLVDGLVEAMAGAGSWAEIRGPLALALLMAAIMLAGELLRAVVRWVRLAQAELVHDSIKSLIHERATAADLAYYESPDYHDQLHRVRANSQGRPIALIENLGTLIQNGLTFIAMAAVLVPYGWWVPIALVVSTLPALWVVLRFAMREHEWRMKSTARQRRTWYLDWLLTTRETASELRIFKLGKYFARSFQDLRATLRRERLAIGRSAAKTEMAAGTFALAVMGATVALMVVRAVQGAMSLGDLAMFYQAFNQGQKLMQSLLSTVGQVYSNILFLGNLFEFLEIEPQITSPPNADRAALSNAPEIRIQGVSFCYPNTERTVFDNLDLRIPGGQVAALLGANGSGKSTLFKLLCRLYEPDSGTITFDGRDLRSMDLDDVRRSITVLFQEPVHYSETVQTNIAFGDLAAEPDDLTIRNALAAAGADSVVQALPRHLDTLLGTWFEGGSELSVGEWQRIALARAALRRSQIVLLDEPTSAMDSWSESDWLQRLSSITAGRTALIITHRLTTARAADVIHVIDGGKIIESGSHDELVEADGQYAESWKRQTGDGNRF